MGLNLLSQMRTHNMMVAKIITALFGVMLNFAGAYWYGTMGIVIAGHPVFRCVFSLDGDAFKIPWRGGYETMFTVKRLFSLARPLVDRFPRIAKLYRSVREEMDFMEEPVETPWGFKLAGNAAMAQGTFEPAETEIVRNLLRDVDILINVGANVGYYCCHALSLESPSLHLSPFSEMFVIYVKTSRPTVGPAPKYIQSPCLMM